MTIWVDAHLSPAIATWITITFGITALALRDVGLRDAEDPEILRQQGLEELSSSPKIVTLLILVDRFGSPPQVIWLTCGNTSNARLKEILNSTLPEALELLRSGEALVEIRGD
ncbi:hypothetical protein ANSO36C_16630 [Nostoc cf. commune SO-36]|uniref:DUF5615 domain-containing protein n=1 Tax=Nostoc cf. commune SO-36 TaxID=449208 RepID=A0ABN6PXS9_NOSCO|nr:DUF5615 family PIN-like protein [Nostoc commune]BDI15861.1 hypothetical protein ANSO36C_16630 [Nostoc cf. commune SO-36]